MALKATPLYRESELQESARITPSTEEKTLELDDNMVAVRTVTVEAVKPEDYYKKEQDKEVTPTTEEQTVYPDAENMVLSSVTVNPAPLEEAMTFTANGEYTPSDGNIGFSTIKVEVQGGGETLTAENADAMQSLLVEENLGKVVTYTGPDTEAYEGGELYLVEEE